MNILFSISIIILILMENNTTNNSQMTKLFNNPQKLAQMFVLVGKSGRGKSYFIRYLLTERVVNDGWEFGLVFCKTKFNGDYDFLPDDKVFQGYNEEILEKYVENLQAIKKKKGKVPPNFIIFDDLVGVLNNQTDFFNNFISVHRHTNTNILIAVQYLAGRKAISPIMREQTSYAIMFQSRTKRTLEKLYESAIRWLG